jgi:ASC-1-like (ASCH) protein
MKHELKLEKDYFGSVLAGFKTFEIRFNDRDYQVGDILVLKEWDWFSESFTGREVEKKITYITNYAQKDGYVVMSIV